MEAKIGNVTVKKIISGSVAIFCNQQVVFVNALPTVNIRLNVLYAFNGTLQSWTGLTWVTYTGGSAGSHNDLSGRDATNAHPISSITGLQAAVDKLAGIEAGAQVNVIETVKVNGVALTPTAKAVDVQIKTINGSAITGTGDITISGGLDKTFQTLTEDATITFNAAVSVNGSVTLTASRILGNITNAVVGEIHCVKVIQGGSGGYTLTYGNQYYFSGGILPILSATVGAVDLLFFEVESASIFTFKYAIFDRKTP
jgi:hypothetical protein